ncbi:MAG: ABC transporter ATP-binding protein [Casimicrobiaceae bacterium]
MLEIANLCAGYGKVPVIHDVSLNVAKGECVALLGPNNAGKTTLLRTISGLVRATSGRIDVDGTDITNMRSSDVVACGVIQIPEGRHIFGTLTVEENLAVGGSRLKARRRAQRLGQIYAQLPLLGQLRERRAGTLSGGQQQMLAIGRALMAEPALLLIDEPTLGLSPIVIEEIFVILQRLQRAGATVLLSEQNADLSLQLCSRGYVLSKGSIVLEGDRNSLRHAALQDVYMA